MIQTFIAVSAAGFSAFYFLHGAYRDFCGAKGRSCGKCSSGGCPAARKG